MKNVKLYSSYLSKCKFDEDNVCYNFGNYDYKKVEKLSQDEKNYVIHLYPSKDTTDASGNLNGFDDALFMKVVIYNENDNTYLVEDCRIDNLNNFFNSNVEFQIRMFKDGSIMIILQNKYKLRLTCNDLQIL